MSASEPIYFYSTKGPFGCFSNFVAAPFTVDGKLYRTSEHYFQAMKFVPHEEIMEEIRACASPMVAAGKGRSRARPLRKDWEAVKDDVMRDAVRHKFRAHPPLRAILLSTGAAVLVERTARDSYWGDGGNGSGKNMLGRILMEVREELRSEEGGEKTSPAAASVTPATAKRSRE